MSDSATPNIETETSPNYRKMSKKVKCDKCSMIFKGGQSIDKMISLRSK
jgi:hypothetical protein